MIRILNLSLVLLLTAAGLKAGDGFRANVVAIIDGNTFEVESAMFGRQRVVLFGVDCPELEQEFGEQARKFAERLLLRKAVTVTLRGKDRYGNYLGIIWLDDRDVRVDLLREGLAWNAEKDPTEELVGYETWARRKERGLWSSEKPVPPWTFRRQQSMGKPKMS